MVFFNAKRRLPHLFLHLFVFFVIDTFIFLRNHKHAPQGSYLFPLRLSFLLQKLDISLSSVSATGEVIQDLNVETFCGCEARFFAEKRVCVFWDVVDYDGLWKVILIGVDFFAFADLVPRKMAVCLVGFQMILSFIIFDLTMLLLTPVLFLILWTIALLELRPQFLYDTPLSLILSFLLPLFPSFFSHVNHNSHQTINFIIF